MCKRYGERTVLDHVQLTLMPGEIVTLIGPNGSGKTTLLHLLTGLAEPDEGSIARQAGITLGYVPQRMAFDAAMPMDVEYFLGLTGAVRHGETEKRAMLEEVGLGRIALRDSVHGLSGGEKQRLMLARALLRRPDWLVLDEPVQGVDVTGQAELYGLITRASVERGMAVLMVSHDLHLVMAATHRVICLNGHVCCAGHPKQVSRDPAFVALFGKEVADQLALYVHHHDHAHDAAGHVVADAHHAGDGYCVLHGAKEQKPDA